MKLNPLLHGGLGEFLKSVCVVYTRNSNFNVKFEVFLAVKLVPKDVEEWLKY